MTTVYGDLVRYRELFASLFRRDLQARYKGSIFGLAWSLANPVVQMAVYALVFSVLWQVTDESISPYPLFLLSGLAVWVFLSGSLTSASRSMVENASLIRKTRFPRQLLPFSSLGTQLVAFAVMLVVIVPLNFVLLPEVRGTVWLAIPLSVLVVGLVGGLSLVVASLNAIYRDVEHLIAALLLPWFFLTPVLYTSDTLPAEGWERLVDVLHWVNFAAPAVTAVRDPLFFGRLPSALDVVYLAGSAVIALALGAWVFRRVDDRIAVEL
jgi:homopolymeric O-antigen transport system permease protein